MTGNFANTVVSIAFIAALMPPASAQAEDVPGTSVVYTAQVVDDTKVRFLFDMPEKASGHLYSGLAKSSFTIGGTEYKKSILTHPENKGIVGFVEYDLDGKFSSFHAIVGMIQPYPKNEPDCDNTRMMSYKVLVDGVKQREGSLEYSQNKIDLPLKGAKLLRLQVDDGRDGNYCDWLAWGNAYLVCDGPCETDRGGKEKSPTRVEIVAPDPPPGTTYGDFKLVLTKPDPKPPVTPMDFKVLKEIPEAGLFRVRVTYSNAPGVPESGVPVTMLVGSSTKEQPSPFHAKPSNVANVYMTDAILLSTPIGNLLTVVASRGDEITADVKGVRGSATVVALPGNGVIPHRGLLSQRKEPKPVPVEIDCSCKSVTLNRIVSRVYTHSTGLGIFENKWHYKNAVEFQVGNSSNPPEKGKVAIPWRKKRDIMQFFFTFPQALAYIVPSHERHLCRAYVEVKYPNPRRSSGSTTKKVLLYTKRGAALATITRNVVGISATRDPVQKGGRGRIRWGVGNSGEYCSAGVPFIIQ